MASKAIKVSACPRCYGTQVVVRDLDDLYCERCGADFAATALVLTRIVVDRFEDDAYFDEKPYGARHW